MLRAIPLFAILLVIYNALLLFGNLPATLDQELFAMNLISGARWSTDVGDLFIILGVVALYVEMFKATRTTLSSVIDHTVSTAVFVVFVIEFITVAGAGNSTFMALTLMSLLDVVAGFTITIVAARRDFAVGEHPQL